MMRLKKKSPVLLLMVLFLSILSSEPASAVPVVKARLDSVTLLMGRLGTLKLTVDEEENVKGYFPIFQQSAERGYASVCNDSVELRLPVRRDTLVNGNRRKVTLDIPVQSFDSGAYRLPEIVYIAGKDTFRSNQVSLKVLPVPVKADTPIADYAGVSDPENQSIFDSLPDWIVNYWWLILLIIICGILVYLAIRKYRRDGSIMPKKAPPSSYEVAIASLHELRSKKLWEQGLEKEYYTDLTDILRKYLYGRFGINAVEMTSRQILAALSHNNETKDTRPYFRQILDMADFVKFAKVRPLPDDNVKAIENAIRFVEETKPAPVPEENIITGDKLGEKENTDKKGGRPSNVSNSVEKEAKNV